MRPTLGVNIGVFNEIPKPTRDNGAISQSSRWRRNWAALVAIGYLLLAVLAAIRWFRFHNEDRAIDAVLYLFLAVAFVFGHLNNRGARRYEEAMKRVKDEHPFPWETDIKASKRHG